MRFKKTAVGAAVASLAMLAAPAYAVSTEVGANTSDSHVISATSTNSIFTVYGFGFIPTTVTCTTVGVSGVANAGVNTPPPNVADLTSSSWNTCMYSSAPTTMTPHHTTAWALNATGGYTAAATDTAVTGVVSNIDVDVHNPFGATCDFHLGGTVAVTFNEVTQVLTVNETRARHGLNISGSTCSSLFQNGDPVDLSGDFPVSSPDGAINIKP